MNQSTNPSSVDDSTSATASGQDSTASSPLTCEGVDCTSAIDQLYSYLDGHCEEVDREVIKGHLDGCSPCLDAFEFHSELQDLVQNRCSSELPNGLRDKVLGALKGLEFEQDSSSTSD